MRMSILQVALCGAFISLAATPPTSAPKLSDAQIKNFWKAKSALSEANANCAASPDVAGALAKFRATVDDIRKTCGRDGVMGADGDPSCGNETPSLPVAPAPAAKTEK